jgi:hypothetical protein
MARYESGRIHIKDLAITLILCCFCIVKSYLLFRGDASKNNFKLASCSESIIIESLVYIFNYFSSIKMLQQVALQIALDMRVRVAGS